MHMPCAAHAHAHATRCTRACTCHALALHTRCVYMQRWPNQGTACRPRQTCGWRSRGRRRVSSSGRTGTARNRRSPSHRRERRETGAALRVQRSARRRWRPALAEVPRAGQVPSARSAAAALISGRGSCRRRSHPSIETLGGPHEELDTHHKLYLMLSTLKQSTPRAGEGLPARWVGDNQRTPLSLSPQFRSAPRCAGQFAGLQRARAAPAGER